MIISLSDTKNLFIAECQDRVLEKMALKYEDDPQNPDGIKTFYDFAVRLERKISDNSYLAFTLGETLSYLMKTYDVFYQEKALFLAKEIKERYLKRPESYDEMTPHIWKKVTETMAAAVTLFPQEKEAVLVELKDLFSLPCASRDSGVAQDLLGKGLMAFSDLGKETRKLAFLLRGDEALSVLSLDVVLKSFYTQENIFFLSKEEISRVAKAKHRYLTFIKKSELKPEEKIELWGNLLSAVAEVSFPHAQKFTDELGAYIRREVGKGQTSGHRQSLASFAKCFCVTDNQKDALGLLVSEGTEHHVDVQRVSFNLSFAYRCAVSPQARKQVLAKVGEAISCAVRSYDGDDRVMAIRFLSWAKQEYSSLKCLQEAREIGRRIKGLRNKYPVKGAEISLPWGSLVGAAISSWRYRKILERKRGEARAVGKDFPAHSYG